MRAVIVGAGAVGQVYGHHLAQGGAEVSVLVRPRHREAAERGFPLTRVDLLGTRATARFVPHEVLTDAAAVRAREFDQVWLCIPTTSLGDPLIEEVVRHTKGTVVSMLPGQGVQERLEGWTSPAQLVMGLITFMSWWSPMDGSNDPRERATTEGVAYLAPPVAPSQFSGERAGSVVEALRAGDLAAGTTANATRTAAFSSALLIPLIATLEVAGWSFASYRASRLPELTVAAAREATLAAAHATKSPPPLSRLAQQPFLLRFALEVAPDVMPVDIEAFLRAHFIKVGAQTRLMLDTAIQTAKAAGIDPAALRTLRGRLRDTAS